MTTRKTSEQKLADLRKKRDQLTAKIQRETARVKSAERKQDTRRKIIAGAIALEHMDHDPQWQEKFRALLKQHVKPSDKELFDLTE